MIPQSEEDLASFHSNSRGETDRLCGTFTGRVLLEKGDWRAEDAWTDGL